jgi:Fic family protein
MSHPWISFRLDLTKAPVRLWVLLGEARSKCEHIAGVPLQPTIAAELHSVYLAKGALATTAIEGNTLTEEQVKGLLAGSLKLPASKEYLQREVQNIIEACSGVWTEVSGGQAPLQITPARVRQFNRAVLDHLDVDEGVVPGQIRQHAVTVGRYRGAPAEDCDFLLEKLCSWLATAEFADPGGFGLVMPLLQAVVAHLYLAWIHPFGDGNGRTARLVEFTILVSAGVPTAAAHLLSNHYNETRARYYRELDRASKSGGDPIPFLLYAVEGFVDQLHEQLKVVWAQQLVIAWNDFLHGLIGPDATPADRRRLDLVLAISRAPEPVALDDLAGLTPALARAYGRRSLRTVRRDVDWALEQNLLVKQQNARFVANLGLILAFLPGRAGNPQVG